MVDIRFEMDHNNITRAYVYHGNEIIKEVKAPSAKELSVKLHKQIGKQKIGRIFVYRGPGGYSRLRGMHALATGLAVGSGAKIRGYLHWDHKLLSDKSADDKIVKAYYPSTPK